MPQEEIKNNLPFVSVVMPVRNEEDFIERGLRAVFAQTYPSKLLEIIIADGESDDSTHEIIGRLRTETDIPIKLINNPKRIAPTGLNIAIGEATGEIVVRVDGHCEVEPDYVANCVKHLQTGKAEGVGGPIETIGETLQAEAVAIAMSSKFGVGGSAFRTINDREMYVDTVAFPGYKKSTLQKVGKFNEELVRNQDDEFNYRIRKMGGKILLSPDIRSRYYSRSTFKSLWRQYYQYGYWKIRVLQLHPKQMSLRQFIPFAFVSTLVFLGFLSIFFGIARWALLLTLGLYFVANIAATIKEGQRTSLKALPYIFLSYCILHISYGLGFISGFFAFRNRWSKNDNIKALEIKF
jgi:glycosyltransferase involved in cell wall biosynthesis